MVSVAVRPDVSVTVTLIELAPALRDIRGVVQEAATRHFPLPPASLDHEMSAMLFSSNADPLTRTNRWLSAYAGLVVGLNMVMEGGASGTYVTTSLSVFELPEESFAVTTMVLAPA
jgi:hypothetical protein